MIYNGKEFRAIPGHRQYAVSADGDVIRVIGGPYENKPVAKSKHRVRSKTVAYNDNYYLYATLQTEDKSYADGGVFDYPFCRPKPIHRLVMLAWVGPCPEGMRSVNHKNGVKHDNRLENLEWISHKDNTRHAYSLGLMKSPKGKDHWRYGKTLSMDTRLKMSLEKVGERHPKFKGWFVKDGVRYPSARGAANATGISQQKIAKLTKQEKDGWSFLPKEAGVESNP